MRASRSQASTAPARFTPRSLRQPHHARQPRRRVVAGDEAAADERAHEVRVQPGVARERVDRRRAPDDGDGRHVPFLGSNFECSASFSKQLALLLGELLGHDDLHHGVEVAAAEPGAAQAQPAPARGARGHLHARRPVERPHLHRRAERSLPRRDGHVGLDVVALEAEALVAAQPHAQAQPFAGDADDLPVAHAGRDLDLELAAVAERRAAAGRRARPRAARARAPPPGPSRSRRTRGAGACGGRHRRRRRALRRGR